MRKQIPMKLICKSIVTAALAASWLLTTCAVNAAVVSDAQDNSVSAQAFKSLLRSRFPLSPTEIHRFKNRAAEQAEASQRPAGPAPAVGTSSTIPVSMSPGGVAPVVRIGQGLITSLVFTDQSGKVWPITSYFIGNPRAFGIQWNKKSGVLMVQGSMMFAHSNIGVMLQGLKVPVMLTLLLGQHEWDYLDYIRVQAAMPGDFAAGKQPVAQTPKYLINVMFLYHLLHYI